MSYLVLFEQLVQIAFLREQVTRNFLRRRNVLACGVGFKVKGGEQTTTPSVVVSVVRKEPARVLPLSDLIPPLVNDVPTDVIETGLIVPFSLDRQGVVRPVRPGVSVAHRDGTAGTAGCVVQRAGQRFLLSNNHVLALLNRARVGDPILQPGPSDGGTLENAIGELAVFQQVHFVDEPAPPTEEPLPTQEPPVGCSALLARLLQLLRRGAAQPSTNLPPLPRASGLYENRADVALVRPFSTVALDPNVLDIDSPPTGIADPKLGLRVFKSGRSTALTSGTISQVDVTVDVQYGDRTARYANQIIITPFTQRGDSGALVLDEQRRAVGLIFSGSDRVSVANPIRFALAALDVDLVTA